MADHSKIFAQITLNGLAGMLSESADKIAARCPAAERIVEANYPPSGVHHRIPRNFERINSPENFKRKAAEIIIYLRMNRLVLKRTGRNHSAADTRWLARAADCRRAAEIRLAHIAEDLASQRYGTRRAAE